MDNLAIMCDEIIQSYEEGTNFSQKTITCKTRNFYILLAFLWIIIALLIDLRIYYYIIKYWAKKNLLPFHDISNELKQVLYWYYKQKMSNKVKDINIKNQAYYVFDNIINIKNFDSNKIKID